MKQLYAIVKISLIAGFFYLVLVTCKTKDSTNNSSRVFKESPGDGMGRVLQQEYQRTADPNTGDVPSERLKYARRIQQGRFTQQELSGKLNLLSGLAWAERGPDNIGGRTRALIYDLKDPLNKKVWAGGVGGGLWWSNDITAADPVWNKVNDTFSNLAITTIAQSPSGDNNLMFFGTGEGWFNDTFYQALGIRGQGIWRSLNGGTTWEHLPSTDIPAFRYIQKIAFAPVGGGGPCPNDTAGVLVATRDNGIMKSVDSGRSWKKVLGGGIGGATTNAAADIFATYYYVYASMGIQNAGGGGIYRSCDAGSNWLKIYQASSDEERIEIAPGPRSINYWYMYVLIQGADDKIKKIMKTENADTIPASAVTWKNIGLPKWCDLGDSSDDFTNGQANYDLIAAMDPNDHQTVYIGGVDLFKSTNSGTNWTQISEWPQSPYCGLPHVHADIHEILFKNCVLGVCDPNELLIATDGGVFRSTNAGASYTSKNKTYNVTQYYSCALHPTLTDYFLGGTQDNGSQKFSSAGVNSATTVSGGDGGFCHIDQDNPAIQITSYIANNYFVSTNGGTSFTDYDLNDRGRFINPSDYDNAENRLYAGDASGHYFRWNRPDINGLDEAIPVSGFNAAWVTHVRVSPTVPNRVYFGLNNGSIVRVDDAHLDATKTGVVIRPDIGNVSVSCIAIDPANENHMLVTYSNYGVTSVYESSLGTGGSLSWNPVEGNLPDMPVRWALFDPRNADWAILATEVGIWSTLNLNGNSTDWQPSNSGFANTRIDMLKYRSSDRLLLAASHGRGMFSANVPAVVPVTLFNFKGALINNSIELSWITATEQNSKGFGIERSYNGTNFTEIGFIPSAGNSSMLNTYQFSDKSIVQENNYYRLRLVDMDDKFEYSRVVLVRKPMRSYIFKVLNNPFNDYIDIQFGTDINGRSQLRLMDMHGRTMQQEILEIVPQSRHRLMIQKNLPGGIYILQVINKEQTYKQELIKQ